MIILIVSLWLVKLQTVAGGVIITSPTAGDVLSGSGGWNITWAETNGGPLISDLLDYTIILYTGNNSNPIPLIQSEQFNFTSSHDPALPSRMWHVLDLKPTSNRDLSDEYFLGLQSRLRENSSIQIRSLSKRFTILDTTGSLPRSPTTDIPPSESPNSEDPSSEDPASEFGEGPSTVTASLVTLTRSGLITDTPTATLVTVPLSGSTPTASILSNPPAVTTTASSSPAPSIVLSRDPRIMGTSGIILIVLIGLIILVCLAGCFACVYSNKRNGRTWRHHPAIKWWNALPPPRPGRIELSAGQGPYDTAELPAGPQEAGPVFELSAGSVRRGVQGNRKDSQNIDQEPGVREESNSGPNEETSSLGISVTDNYTLALLERAYPASATDFRLPATERANASRSHESRAMLGEDELRELAGAFAPAPRHKSKQRPWLYR